MRKYLAGLLAGAALSLASATSALAFDLGVVAFQMSAETHARVANAVEAAAKARGWSVTVLNSSGTMPTHLEQLETLVQKGVDGIVVAMGKPVEADAQLAAAKAKGIPVITVMSGTSPHTLFDIQVNEYKVGAEAAMYLLGQVRRLHRGIGLRALGGTGKRFHVQRGRGPQRGPARQV